MKFKEIIVWLIIFIIGSLIVSFLIYPETFVEVIENIQTNILPKAKTSVLDTIRLVPSEMEEYTLLERILYKGCASVEAHGESQSISNMKQKVCREACGKKDMKYYSNDCEKDLLVCYCLP